MIVLIDTNVIMDALQERQPFDLEAKEIFLLAEKGKYSCCLTANAVTDVFYLYSRVRGLKSAKKALFFLLEACKIVSITYEDCIAALFLPIDDFEDALAVTCAQKAGIDYIVTRDEEFLCFDSPVKVIAPADFLKELEKAGI